MYKYENGVITNIPSDKIEDIANALHCSPVYLMGWSESGERLNVNTAQLEIGKDSSLRFALYSEVDQMDEEDLKAVLDYAEYIKSKKKK
jgi:hypothetical protein